MPKNENKVEMRMDRIKETKGTVVFAERIAKGERPHTFYILKETYASLASPESITVTIESN